MILRVKVRARVRCTVMLGLAIYDRLIMRCRRMRLPISWREGG